MSLLDDVSIVVTPNGYKAGTLYGVLPTYAEGIDLVDNGDFATDLSGWNITGNDATHTVTWTASGARFQSDTTSPVMEFKQLNLLLSGKQYVLTCNIAYTGVGQLRVNVGTNLTPFTEGANTKYFTATSSTMSFLRENANVDAIIDNVIVKEVTASDMDVTRATAATRVDEDGLVNYAEILGSEQVTGFTNGTTYPFTTFATSGNNITSAIISSAFAGAASNGISVTSGEIYKVTFDYTKNSGDDLRVLFAVSANGAASAISNNVIISASGTYTEYFTITSTTTSYLQMGTGNSGHSLNASITNVSVKEATRDNVPRIDYTGGGCPHILAEPQRTNLIPYSEDFSESAWTKTRCTIDSGGHTSPSGESNAFKMTATDDDARLQDGSEAAGVVYTQSIYVKSATGSDVSGQIDFTGTQIQTFTATSEWQRVDTTSDDTRAGVVRVRITNSGDELYIWGAQLEVGSYPTSYIPTSGSTVTRNQDIFTRDGIGSLINSTEGVLFVELENITGTDATNKMISITDGSLTNKISLFVSSNQISVESAGSGTNLGIYSKALQSGFNKIAVKYKVNDCALWVNGTEYTDTSFAAFTSSTLNALVFDRGDGTQNLFGKVKQLQVYKTALTDAQLTSLTS
jgi:hypothetical protein